MLLPEGVSRPSSTHKAATREAQSLGGMHPEIRSAGIPRIDPEVSPTSKVNIETSSSELGRQSVQSTEEAPPSYKSQV